MQLSLQRQAIENGYVVHSAEKESTTVLHYVNETEIRIRC